MTGGGSGLAPAFNLPGSSRTSASSRTVRLVVGLVAAVVGVSVVVGGAVTAAQDEQAKVDKIIAGDKHAGELGRHAVAADADQYRDSGASHVLDDPYFASAGWRDYVTEQKKSDAEQLRQIRASARAAADGYLFPGPRAELLAYTATVTLSVPTVQRLDLYAEKVRQTELDRGGKAAADLARQMFADKAVADAVSHAAGADQIGG